MKNFIKVVLVFSATLFVSTMTYAASSPTINNPTMIIFQGYDSNSVEFKKLCQVVRKEVVQWSFGTVDNTQCLDAEVDANVITNFESQKNYGTKVQLIKDDKNSKNKLLIVNLKPVDSTDPIDARWEIENSTDGLIAIRKIIKRYNIFSVNKNQLKKELVEAALNDKINDYNFAQTYNTFINQDPKNRRYAAAGLVIASSLGLSTLGYYSSSGTNNPNNRDWDFNAKESIKARLVSQEALRFDDNHFSTNAGHYLAGTYYYDAARTSGLGRLDSLLFTFAGSSAWEYLGEYREVVAINDQINTTLGGFVLGEAIFQTVRIFQKGPNTGVNRIMRSLFGLPEKGNAWLENSISHEKRAYDINLSSEQLDFWSKLDLYAQVEKSNDKDRDHVVKKVGLDAEVINIPMFEQPGQVKQMLTDSVLSDLMIEKGAGGNIDTLKIFAKTTLAAYYVKNLHMSEKEQLEGYQLFIGPTAAFDVNEMTVGENPRSNGSDFRGVVHVLGNTIDLSFYTHGYKIRATLDVYGDFAMIRSWGFDAATEDKYKHVGRTKVDAAFPVQSVLRNEGYYYGAGVTGALRVTVEKGNFEAGASYEDINSSMINGRARFYESNTINPHAHDNVEDYKGWVAYSVSNSLKIEIGAEKINRSGTALGKTITTSEVVKYGRLIYKY
jgi:hypothetical protein